MAVINVIQPRFGRITVTDSSESHYTVRYTPNSPGSFFNGFKVYCHACGTYVFQAASESQSVSINFTALQSDGHPGPFDISANEHEVEFLVETYTNDESMGTTTPVEKIMGVDVGGTVSFTIKATAKSGYEFVKWVSDTGNEFTSATVNISVTVADETDDYRCYTAYFRVREYKSRCVFNFTSSTSGSTRPRFNSGVVSISEISDYVTVKDSVEGTSVDVNVALVSKDVLEVPTGGQVTFTVQMLPEAETYGVKFLGWVAGDYTAEEGLVVYGNSITVTNTATGLPQNYHPRVYAWFGFGGNMATVKFVRPEYYHPAGLPTARSWDGVAAGSSSLGDPDVYDKDAAIYTWRFRDGDLYIWWDGPTDALAVVHGSSSARCEIGEWTVPGASAPATIKITPSASAAGEEFVVYLCTHLLVCTDDGAHLECKPPQLLYDCSRPAS